MGIKAKQYQNFSVLSQLRIEKNSISHHTYSHTHTHADWLMKWRHHLRSQRIKKLLIIFKHCVSGATFSSVSSSFDKVLGEKEEEKGKFSFAAARMSERIELWSSCRCSFALALTGYQLGMNRKTFFSSFRFCRIYVNDREEFSSFTFCVGRSHDRRTFSQSVTEPSYSCDLRSTEMISTTAKGFL